MFFQAIFLTVLIKMKFQSGFWKSLGLAPDLFIKRIRIRNICMILSRGCCFTSRKASEGLIRSKMWTVYLPKTFSRYSEVNGKVKKTYIRERKRDFVQHLRNNSDFVEGRSNKGWKVLSLIIYGKNLFQLLLFKK